MQDKYEKVHTMTDYYDGPRGGVADFNGSPVVYESEFTDIDSDESDTFLLQPISDDTFRHALEDWEIWLKWERAHKQGTASLETHPALPEDRRRHEELALLLANELKVDKQNAIRAKGDFTMIDGQLMVKWELISRASAVTIDAGTT